MKYDKIVINDTSLLDEPNVAFYVQGCPFRCAGCNNAKGWLFDGGNEFTEDVIIQLEKALNNCSSKLLCITGGEPLAPENRFLTHLIISTIKTDIPDSKIYLWTGYESNQILDKSEKILYNIMQNINILISGPFKREEKQDGLYLIGSMNQEIKEINK